MEKDLIIKDGNLSPLADKVFSLVGVAAAISLVVFFDELNGLWFYLVVVIAIIFGYGSAWAGIVKKWGYAPFTNDPLGWRKAKESYKKTAGAENGEQDSTASSNGQ